MVIISGASGFIGHHLKMSLPDSYGVSLRTSDWKNKFLAADVIINLVGKAHDHKAISTEQDYYEANVILTKRIFNAFLQSSAKLLIHVSSLAAVEEYDALEPLKEIDECRPQSWYGKSKREAEQWLIEQELPVHKKLIIIRPPMVHGEGDKGNLGLLYKLISKGIPYPLSSFDNKRSFISIENFVFFIRQILEKHEFIASGIYHISDDEPVSTKDIIEIIKKVTGRNTPNLALPQFLVKVLARLGDLFPLPLDSKRLKKMTGNLVVSNDKIKRALRISKLPISANDGLLKTIRSFSEK